MARHQRAFAKFARSEPLFESIQYVRHILGRGDHKLITICVNILRATAFPDKGASCGGVAIVDEVVQDEMSLGRTDVSALA